MTSFDRTTGTYSNGMRVGDLVSCRWNNDDKYGEGIVTKPHENHCYGIYADWIFKGSTRITNGYMYEKDVYLKEPIEVLGDNDDDCV